MASVGRGAVEGLADFDGTLEAGLRVVEVAEFVLDDAEIVDACGDRRMSGSEFSFGDVDGAEVTHLGLFEEVVLSGERMPLKSTYFSPKLPTGLVINRLV